MVAPVILAHCLSIGTLQIEVRRFPAMAAIGVESGSANNVLQEA